MSTSVEVTTPAAAFSGVNAGPQFKYSSVTDASDPGDGFVRFNNNTLSSITAAYFDNLQYGGGSATGWLDSIDDGSASIKGFLRVSLLSDPLSAYVLLKFEGTVADSTGYRTLNSLSAVDSFGSFSHGDILGVALERNAISGGLPVATSITELKAFNGASDPTVMLEASAQKGLYVWNASVAIADHQVGSGTDVFEKRYIAPDSAAVGAYELIGMLTETNKPAIAYADRIDLVEYSESASISPTVVMVKISPTPVDGWGGGKLQFQASATTPLTHFVDAGRMSTVVTDVTTDNYTAVIDISPNVHGNDEAIPAQTFAKGTTNPAYQTVFTADTPSTPGSGYAVNDEVNIVSASTGVNGVAKVTSIDGSGGITGTQIIRPGEQYTDGESVTYTAKTGSGTGAAGTINSPGIMSHQGFGTHNAAVAYYLNNEKALYLADDKSHNIVSVDSVLIQNGTDSLSNFGVGTINVADKIYIRNTVALERSSGGYISHARNVGRRFRSVTSNRTLDATDECIEVNATSGNITITLPNAGDYGNPWTAMYHIYRSDGSGNTVTIAAGSGETVNDAASITLAGTSGLTLFSTIGSDWYAY